MNFNNTTVYSTTAQGTATDRLDYLGKIRTFLITTSNFTEVFYDNSSSEHYLVVQRDSEYYHFQTYSGTEVQGISFYLSYGYESTDFYSQSTIPTEYYDIVLNGAISQYYLFDNGLNIVLVTEFNAGFYCFCCMGIQTSNGNYTNSYFCGNIRGQNDTNNKIENYFTSLFTDNHIIYLDQVEYFSNVVSNIYRNAGIPSFYREFIGNSKIKYNEKGMLFTPMFYMNRGSYYSPMIEISDVLSCNTTHFTNAETFSIGDKDFITFPNYQKLVPVDYSDYKTRALNIALRIA